MADGTDKGGAKGLWVYRLAALAAVVAAGWWALAFSGREKTMGPEETVSEQSEDDGMVEAPRMPGTDLENGISCIVAEGDTLQKLAEIFAIDAAVLARANHLPENAPLEPGRELAIPVE